MRTSLGKGAIGTEPPNLPPAPRVPLTPSPVPTRPLPEGCPGAEGAPRHMRRRLPVLERTESTEHSPDASIDLDALETPSGSDGFEWEGEAQPGSGHGGPPRSSPPVPC